MSDYNTTVGVQLYDDFDKIKNELPQIINMLGNLKSVLSQISRIKISSQGLGSIAKQLEKISNIKGLDTQISKTNELLNNLNISNLSSMREEITRMKQEYKSFIDMMNRGTGNTIKSSNIANSVKNTNYNSSGLNDIRGTRNQNITSYINNMNEGLKSVDKTAQKTKKSITSMFSLGRAYWFINYTKQAFRGLGNIIKSSLDFTETENYFSRAMGNMYDKAMSFQNKLTEMYGMSMNTMMNAQATYKNMIGSLGGLSNDMSYKLSETVTKMTLDFSSLYNVDFDKTVQKMQSALSKQVRPIRSVSGFDITQNVLGATASNIGITRAISDMNELEKRLLIILTLMNQMRNSGAMNDFSRTIEQPSNQLRILKEQLIEVGRWIGSVFYSTIGTVLPYINGFVMAIKELVKTFALFVGYTVPDSSGETGTILDQLGDSTDDLNTGIGNVGSGLDTAKKKANELKGSLAGFDKLNVISKPKKDTSSSSSNGTGGLTVDPKILDALNKYDYIFDSIRMKAHDIRDRLLEWGKIAQDAINENIFKPMQYSWNMYGYSTIKNFKSSFDDITYIASGVFDVVSDKWKPFFQQASNFFFSLLDTCSLVFSSITSLAKDVWKTGGKVFLEGLFDLTTATLELAVAINDKFIKPTVKLFKNTFGVVLSKSIGLALNLIGQFMSYLSNLISLISKSETAVKTLGATFTIMFATIKVGQFMKLWNSMSTGVSITTRLTSMFVDHTKIGSKMYELYVKTRSGFETLKMAWQGGLSVISGLFSGMSNLVGRFSTYITGVAGATASTTGLTTAQKLCAAATTLLQTALNFLAAHPLVAVALAIGTAVVALGTFASSQEKAKMSIEDCSQEIQDEYEAFNSLSESIDSAKESAEDQIAKTEAQVRMAQNYIDQLKKLADDKGYVTNIDEAQRLITEINNIIPDTVKLTKEGRLEWQKTPAEIDKATQSLIKQAKQQAYQELYVETIKNQIKQEQKYNEELKKSIDLADKQKKEWKEYNKTHENANITLEEYCKIQTVTNKKLEEQRTLVRQEKEDLDKTSNSVKDLEKQMSNLNNQNNNVAQSSKKVDEATKKTSDIMKQSAKDASTSGSNAGKNYTTNMANELSKGKENVATVVKNNSAYLTETLKSSPINYSTQVESIVKKAQARKDETNLLTSKGLYFNSDVASMTNKAKKKVEEATKGAGKINIEANVTGDAKGQGKKFGEAFNSGIKNSKKVTIKGIFDGIGNFLKGTFGFYASGGFPDVGEMFIARERGPELVGTLGGKTAVANNKQIEVGIENASYRGMSKALKEMGGFNPNIYLHHQTMLGNKVVEESIDQINDEHVLKTGKPKFVK